MIERRAQLVRHRGQKLALVPARRRQLPALLLDLSEELGSGATTARQSANSLRHRSFSRKLSRSVAGADPNAPERGAKQERGMPISEDDGFSAARTTVSGRLRHRTAAYRATSRKAVVGRRRSRIDPLSPVASSEADIQQSCRTAKCGHSNTDLIEANGVDPDPALRGLTGLAAEGYKAFNSLGIGSLGTDAVVSDPDSVTHPIQQNNWRSYEHRN